MFTFQPIPVAASIVLLALFGGAPETQVPSAVGPTAVVTDPPCQVTGPNPTFVGQAATYTSVFSGTNFVWHFTTNTAGAFFCGPTNQQTVCVNTTQPGFFRLEVDFVTPTGPTDCAAEVDVLPGGDCQINGPAPICAGQEVTYSSAFPGTNFSWSFTSNSAGAFFCGPTDQQSVCVDTTQAGAFRLQLDYVQPSGPQTCAVEVGVRPDLEIVELAPQEACVGDDVVFSTGILSGNPPFTFEWTVDHGSGTSVIPGANTDTLTLLDVSLADSGTYCVTVTGECGEEQSCATLEVEICEEEDFCTLTQGGYGNPNGQFNGVGRLELINGLLSTDLVVGKPGRSLRILAGNGSCVISRLPANSGPEALPAFGDATLSASTCQTSPVALPLKNTRFKNVLLGQVITLSLNTRLDSDLSGVGICESMTTQKGETFVTVDISSDVFTELAAAGLPFTVGGLLELANRALAGQATGVASLSEINDAVDAINRVFDECRTLIECTEG